ncbi:MAG: hypothetical protein C0510_04835 [Erythrobacter sp.]|nr:hypothetical protein [Erythrobacter sp.]
MDELQYLNQKRKALAEFLLGHVLDESVGFAAMDDGGMGSYLVVQGDAKPRERVWPFREAKYVDDDGIDVFITLFCNDAKEHVEVAFWKVDFEELIRFPTSNDIEIIGKTMGNWDNLEGGSRN